MKTRSIAAAAALLALFTACSSVPTSPSETVGLTEVADYPATLESSAESTSNGLGSGSRSASSGDGIDSGESESSDSTSRTGIGIGSGS